MKDNLALLKEMVGVLEENNLTEVTFAVGKLKVSVKKTNDKPSTCNPVQVHPDVMPSVQKKPVDENLVPVKSPLAGVFYRAPRPGADPYVDIGDVVEKEQALCIVEAMKLMNEISSEIKGRIAGIEVENAQPVEQGQILFYLEPVE